ncbi:hypothetical protein ACFX2I_001324 [Malus domestica]
MLLLLKHKNKTRWWTHLLFLVYWQCTFFFFISFVSSPRSLAGLLALPFFQAREAERSNPKLAVGLEPEGERKEPDWEVSGLGSQARLKAGQLVSDKSDAWSTFGVRSSDSAFEGPMSRSMEPNRANFGLLFLGASCLVLF